MQISFNSVGRVLDYNVRGPDIKSFWEILFTFRIGLGANEVETSSKHENLITMYKTHHTWMSVHRKHFPIKVDNYE